MKRQFRIISKWLPVLLLTGCISCTEIVHIDLDSTYTRLVVQGSVTTDSVRHRVELSTSSDYFANEPSPRVSDAVVEIAFNETSILLEEHDTIPGLYMTPQGLSEVK